MIKFFKFILFLLAFVILIVIIFFFWGSSGSITAEDLNKEITYNAERLPSKDTLTVMTYNIGYLSGMTNNLPVIPDKSLHSENFKDAIELLKVTSPDIIGFQEIDFGAQRSFSINQLDSLALHAGYHYGVAATNWDKQYLPFPYWPPSVHFGKIHSGQAVLSNFPILESQRIAMDKPQSAPFYYNAFYLDRLIQVLKVDIGANRTPLILLNVHLEAFDEETREKQAEKVLAVYRKYAAEYPVLLIGDFNARPPYSTEKVSNENTINMFLTEPGLRSAIDQKEYLAEERVYFTFDTAEPYEMLDYIFYNANKIREVESFVVTQAADISDHFPVLMKFTLVNN